MSNIRTVRKVITGKRATNGAGVKLVRVVGYYDTKEFDPFLRLVKRAYCMGSPIVMSTKEELDQAFK